MGDKIPTETNIKSFLTKILIQSFIFVVALSLRDTIKSTLQLIPIPNHNIWWKWIQTILNLLCVVLVIWCLIMCKLADAALLN
jgi:hypothetical protein